MKRMEKWVFWEKTMRRGFIISVPLSFDIHDMKLWGNVSFASMALSPSARAGRKHGCIPKGMEGLRGEGKTDGRA